MFKVAGLANGELSLVLHVLEEDVSKAFALQGMRGATLMVAVEEI